MCRVHRSAALRRRVAGVAPVGGGLFLLGVSAYVVLGAAGHALAPRDYAAVASLYLLVAITSPGVFTALEQETNREVSSRRATGVGTAPVGRAGLLVGAGFAGLVAVALLAAAPLLVPRVLAGSWGLLAAAVVAACGAAAVYLLRGLFAGEQRFGWYAASLGLEGGARLVPCVVLALVGATDPLAYGWAFALGTGVAAVLCLPGRRALADPGPPVEVRAMARATGLLIVASGLTYVVANTAPLVLTARLPAAPELAASYVSLFVLARIPVFLFGPVQAFLLPTLTAGAERADLALPALPAARRAARGRRRRGARRRPHGRARAVGGAHVLRRAARPSAHRRRPAGRRDRRHARRAGAAARARRAAGAPDGDDRLDPGDPGVRRRARRPRRPGDRCRGRAGRRADGGVPGHGRRRSPPGCAAGR